MHFELEKNESGDDEYFDIYFCRFYSTYLESYLQG